MRPSPYEALLATGDFALFAVRRFFTDRLSSSVAALTYTTLLAIVPLMVIAFSILSSFPAFGSAQTQIEDLVFNAVVPETGAAIRDYLSSFTRNASDLTTLGVVGLAITALFLLSTIEGTLNHVWHVEHRRPILVRFLMYWAVLTLGPLLIGASITLTSDAAHMIRDFVLGPSMLPAAAEIADAPRFLTAVLRIAITATGLTALFVLVPARHVRIMDAAIGAALAAVTFEILATLFNAFILSGRAYTTIYGAVVAVPVFLIWIYTSWTVIIYGAVVAASLPDWRHARSIGTRPETEPEDRLEVALRLLDRLYRHSRTGGALSETELLEDLPLGPSDELLERLRCSGYLVEAEDGGLSLARDPHTTLVASVAADVGVALHRKPRQADGPSPAPAPDLPGERDRIGALLSRLHAAEDEVLGVTLASVFENRHDAPERGDEF